MNKIKKRLENSLELSLLFLSLLLAIEINKDIFNYNDIEDEFDSQHINTPINIFGLLDSVKKKFYKGLLYRN
ncbi:hypothetical protein RhiirA5_443815 [Rhizophagus irregularis]|uniref:Uncharacterized protein n=1 Tax=Rhizophagus irregularis TaxID=588596 RepID=A0A2N0NDM8_9GLOM|nr:hypothetical protein RhiirA5_443815 [Rhizophagus irregularis]